MAAADTLISVPSVYHSIANSVCHQNLAKAASCIKQPQYYFRLVE